MDKPSNGINPKPAGTQNGPAPKNKGLKPGVGQASGSSLPKGAETKVPSPGPGTVQN